MPRTDHKARQAKERQQLIDIIMTQDGQTLQEIKWRANLTQATVRTMLDRLLDEGRVYFTKRGSNEARIWFSNEKQFAAIQRFYYGHM